MSVNKKGQLLNSTVVSIIIAIAIAASLIIFISGFFSPGYNEPNEIAKAYLERLEEEIEVANSGGVGEFALFERGKDEEEFYLVYFGSVGTLTFDEKVFSSKEIGKNEICVCYDISERTLCGQCFDLDLPVEKRVWPIVEGERVSIAKNGEGYSFYVG